MSEAPGLLRSIVTWGNRENRGGAVRLSGRGWVTELVPTSSGLLLLVEVIARPGRDEPEHSLLIPASELGLMFFPSVEAEERWFAWMMDDPQRVVSLVPKNDDPQG